jgi:hypothetical protein
MNGKDVDGSIHGLISNTIPSLAWRDCGKQQRNLSG